MPVLLTCFLSFTLSFSPTDTDTIPSNSLLYNGMEYAKQYTVDMGSPFFSTENSIGDILYQGNWYRGVIFFYDCEDEVLVITLPEGQRMQLVMEKVNAFTLDNHSFLKLQLKGQQAEFYELLFQGQRQLLVKWRKYLIKNMQEQSVYVTTRKIFVSDGSALVNIEKLKDFMDLFPSQKKLLRQIYRERDLSFRKDPVKASNELMKALKLK
jgi:hypothetical protein